MKKVYSNQDNPCTKRGGNYNNTASDNPAGNRNNNSQTNANDNIGFRPTLIQILIICFKECIP